jgi:xanthine dehydrogenase YagT iron-sulfur-binding subunit
MLRELDEGVPSAVSDHLAAPPEPSNLELRERMSGNLCRCGAYVNIVVAIASEVVGSDAARGAMP